MGAMRPGLVLLACLAAAPAAAQGQLRMVPVPADAAVVVPPRSALPVAPMPSTPPPALWEALRAVPPAPPPAAAPVAGGLGTAAAAALPLAAGALLGATLPGSGGAAAPARTR